MNNDGVGRVTPDCLTCGACCLGHDRAQAYIPLSESDVMRLTAKRDGDIITSDAGYAYLRTGKDGRRCVCLDGELGAAVSCAVYDERPQKCREYPVGGWECRTARKQEGIE